MAIFAGSYDLLVWVLQATRAFPRMHRHDFTQRLLGAAFDLRERLEEANLRRAGARRERLRLADEALAMSYCTGGWRQSVAISASCG